MAKDRILVVEDDADIVTMLKIYFESQGYEVSAALRGMQALAACRKQVPNIIILDINLPDIDGYEVCRALRSGLRTSHIPIIFLTQKDQRSDKIAGLELGADDYVTKPFDIEELKLRVQNALRRAGYENLTSPITGLPSGKLIEEQLKKLLQTKPWAVLYVGITHLKGFNDVYGFVAGDDLVRFAGITLTEIIDEIGTMEDFIGHIGSGDFMIIVPPEAAERIRQESINRFAHGVGAFYSFRDRERGYVLTRDENGQEQHLPLATMAIGVVTDATRDFADIREITEVAADARRDPSGRAE